MINSRTIS